MKLADPSLLKSQCLVDGKWWWEGLSHRQPRDRRGARQDPALWRSGDDRRDRSGKRAFGPWSKTLPKERAQILRRWFDLIIANRDDIALIMTSEQGKPLAEARGEVGYAATFIEWFAEEAKRIYGEIIPTFRAIPASSSSRSRLASSRRSRRGISRGHDHAQGGAGARGRLHHGGEARGGNAADRARAGRTGGAGRHSAGRVSTS